MKPERTPGAIVRLNYDPTHFVSFGQDESGYALVLSDRIFEPVEDGVNVALYDEPDLRVAGFMWPSMEEALAGKAYVIVERHGKGNVTLFAEHPYFRGVWPTTARLLLNALFLGPTLSR